MIEFYRPIIERATTLAIAGGDPLTVLRELPLSVFGRVLVQPAVECPYLVDYLPKIPPIDVQTKYNGRANLALLPSSSNSTSVVTR